MPGMEGVVEQIKERLDIVSMVGSQVELKKSGRNLRGLCPFHSEKTPSFYVFPDQGNYHCFGCGASGDVFTYLMKTQNLAFGDALRLLAEKTGVALPERKADTAEQKGLDRLREVCAAAAEFFHQQLRTEAGRAAREYLVGRGIELSVVESFQLGYAPDGWDRALRHLTERGHTTEELERVGIVAAREGGGHYDRFRNRLMFPIADYRGRVIGFGARAMDDSHPKYLNSPQTPLFDKGGSLYGIDKAAQGIRALGYAVIVEGYFDVLIPHQYGINNVVASLGTALTERQVTILKRLSKKLVLALDADAAGDEATRRGLEIAVQVLDRKVQPVPTGRGGVRYEETVDAEIRILRLPRGKDPDEVVREELGAWQRLVDEAQPVVDFYFTLLSGRLDLSQPQNKSLVVDQLLPIIRELAGDRIQQWHYVQRLARMVRVDERVLAARLARISRSSGQRPSHGGAPAPVAARPALGLEEYYLGLLLASLPEVPPDVVVHPDEAAHPLVRQVLEAVWMVAETGSLNRELLDRGLGAELRAFCAELESRMAALPPLGGQDLLTAYESSALRLQEQSCRRAIKELRYLIQEAEERKDLPEVAELTRREHELNLRLDEIFKLQAQRQSMR